MLSCYRQAGSSTSDKGIALPSFSCSPLEYITSIGEHLLVLPQHLEAYAPREQEGHFVHTWISKLARMTADLYIGQVWLSPSPVCLSCLPVYPLSPPLALSLSQLVE